MELSFHRGRGRGRNKSPKYSKLSDKKPSARYGLPLSELLVNGAT